VRQAALDDAEQRLQHEPQDERELLRGNDSSGATCCTPALLTTMSTSPRRARPRPRTPCQYRSLQRGRVRVGRPVAADHLVEWLSSCSDATSAPRSGLDPPDIVWGHTLAAGTVAAGVIGSAHTHTARTVAAGAMGSAHTHTARTVAAAVIDVHIAALTNYRPVQGRWRCTRTMHPLRGLSPIHSSFVSDWKRKNLIACSRN